MIPKAARTQGTTRVLFALACTVVIIAGLEAIASFIVPILVAFCLALLCVPPMRRLRRHGVPEWLAIGIVIACAITGVIAVTALIGRSVAEFRSDLPVYAEHLDQLVLAAVDWFDRRGVHLERDEFTASIASSAILGLVGDTLTGLLSALSNIGLVLLTMAFMLTEARGLPDKLRRAMGDPKADLSEFRDAAERIADYLSIKAKVSTLTGVLIGLICWAVGLDYPLLWGIIAFLFNFIPNIGSFIAAIPAILLGILTLSPIMVLLLTIGYLSINIIIGNILEPHIMGQKLGLSTLVVLLSMLFWNWVWGPVGMLISVPLTVIVKITLEHTRDLRWLAVLLGPNKDPADKRRPGES